MRRLLPVCTVALMLDGCGVVEEPGNGIQRPTDAIRAEETALVEESNSRQPDAPSTDIFAIKEASGEALPAFEVDGLIAPTAVQRRPAGQNPERELGLKAAAEGRHQEAIERLSIVVQENGDDWQARFTLANELAVEGKPLVALVHLKRILSANPRELEALVLRGIIHLQLGRHDEAAKDLLTAIDRPSPSSRALAYAAMAMLELGRNDEAERLATRSLDKPDRMAPIAYQVRGHARLRMKRVDQAAEDLAELERIGPADQALEMLRTAVAAARRTTAQPAAP